MSQTKHSLPFNSKIIRRVRLDSFVLPIFSGRDNNLNLMHLLRLIGRDRVMCAVVDGLLS